MSDASGRSTRVGPPRAVLLVAGIVGLGIIVLGGGTGIQVGGDGYEVEASRTSPEESVVRSFTAAVIAGDRTEIGELLAQDAAPVALPGVPLSLPPGEALAFFGAVMEFDTLTCEAGGPSLSGSSVTCASVVDSRFAQAANVGGRVVPVRYQLSGDVIVAIERDATGAPELVDYCYWTERQVPEARLFDHGCRPIPNAGLAPVHASHAGDFVLAGRPRSGATYRNGRIEISLLVYRIEEAQGFARVGALTESAMSAADFPGVVGYGPAPSISAVLAWSEVVYRVMLGTCFVDGSLAPARFRLECPASVWSGPLVERLGLDEIQQALTMTVDDGEVTAVAGATNRRLFSAFVRACQAVRQTHPNEAAAIFDDGCRPIYSAEAAHRLLAVLEDTGG